MDKEQLDLYFEVLKDYKVYDLKISLIKCARKLIFFPKPVDIIDNAKPEFISTNPIWNKIIKMFDDFLTKESKDDVLIRVQNMFDSHSIKEDEKNYLIEYIKEK